MKQIQALARAGYITACILTVVGVYACLSRYILPEGVHLWLSNILYGTDYTRDALPALASKPGIEVVHRIFGAAYLIIGLMQFSKSFRRKRPQLHRTLGKIFMVFSITGAVSGILFAILVPFAGVVELIPVLLFASFMIYATYRAYAHIRRGEVTQHREWVARSYAIGLGVASIRVVFLILKQMIIANDRDILMAAFWLGWILTLSAVEVYNQMLQAHTNKRKAKATA
ncbi:DUF2306 domain-containing protein [Microscilla marina]|uniref:Lipoprotein, putative n=1 Tax=Microscilla marina ATCC 23134 TaxID=313606 RepID=A1ZNM1_MICM2|nr:DUF2306 domain-containing protein [Microscilla marina]EAY27910.1 lipoprotein, putative [Microscilla marina ATCC 23134]